MPTLILVLFWICATASVNSQNLGASCKLKNGNSGICKVPSECKEAREEIKKGQIPKTCGFEGTSIVVCCPIKKPGEISQQKCKKYSKFEMDENGVSSCNSTVERNEFPHMAALGFFLSAGAELRWKCSGSIISEMYILTSASCIYYKNKTIPWGVRVSYVMVGVTNLNETEHRQILDTDIKIQHPQFQEGRSANDLALVKLKEPIKFNAYIRPACLYTETRFNTNNAVFTGWNREEPNLGNTSQDLEKATFGFNKTFPENCVAAPGGPLQIPQTNDNAKCTFDIVAITSWGRKCGVFPRFYTEIYPHLGWIEKMVWPEEL